MADVFISYSPLDHARVRPIAERLASLGYNVTWEHSTRVGQAKSEEIERRIDAAAAVITVWTHQARNATRMFAYAARALDAQKLLQLRLDDVSPPAPFHKLPVADMSGDRAEWGPFEDALQRLARGAPAQEPAPRVGTFGFLSTPAPVGAPKLLTLCGLLVLIGYVAAVTATYSGAMTPEQLKFALTGMLGAGGACAAFAAYRFFIVRRSGG